MYWACIAAAAMKRATGHGRQIHCFEHRACGSGVDIIVTLMRPLRLTFVSFIERVGSDLTLEGCASQRARTKLPISGVTGEVASDSRPGHRSREVLSFIWR